MIYITGDFHGEYGKFKSAEMRKLKKGDTLIICGDFGFVWDNSKIEQKILKKLAGKEKCMDIIEEKGKYYKLYTGQFELS